MKIAIVVQGRFHAFDLARALLRRGHDVTLFTNYPKWAVKRFDFPTDRVRSFWVHGVLTRGAQKIQQKNVFSDREQRLHTMFGRWAAAELSRGTWDVVHCWSGVSEELLQPNSRVGGCKLLMRGSSHVRIQAKVLEEEERRTGKSLDRPSPWMISREQREYALTDRVVVLSSFAYRSFVEEGFPSQKLCLLLLGAQTEALRPSREIVDARCRRIVTGEPLRILNVGTISFRKGMRDVAEIVRALRNKFEFHFVGPIAPEANALAKSLNSSATFVPKQSQKNLPDFYAWGDIFILPTVEDGFPTVLGQAAASALPILTTPNGAGLDIVQEGETGWVLPIRNPDAFIEQLRWCDSHRDELVRMVRRIYNDFQPRDWSDVAADFEKICIEGLEAKRLASEKATRLEGAEV